MTRAVQELPTGDPLVSGGLDPFFVVVAVLMAAGFALFLWLLVRNLGIIRRAGAPRGRASLGERLQELDDLHRRGVITAAEHAQARQRALTSS